MRSCRDRPLTRDAMWVAIHSERAGLTEDLQSLDDDGWTTPSPCAGWTVEDVVAHLTGGARIGRFRWLTSMPGARFDADLHNQRRLVERRSATPQLTLERFRSVARRCPYHMVMAIEVSTSMSSPVQGWRSCGLAAGAVPPSTARRP